MRGVRGNCPEMNNKAMGYTPTSTTAKSNVFSPVDLQRKNEALKFSRQLLASGLYVWAEQWEKWANGPLDAPQPPNYHNESLIVNGAADPRTKTFQKSIRSQLITDAAYYHWLARSSRTHPSTTGFKAGGGCGTKSTVEGERPRYVEEKSNAELGLIRDSNTGYPAQLIKKLQDLRKKYPELYAKSKEYVV